MDLTVDIKEVNDRVKIEASFVGRDAIDAQGVSMYDRIRITEQDRELIQRYIDENIADLVTLFGDLYRYSDRERIDIRFRSSFIESFKNMISNDVISYLVNGTTAKWLAFVGSDKSVIYANTALEKITQIKIMLFTKKRPARYE